MTQNIFSLYQRKIGRLGLSKVKAVLRFQFNILVSVGWWRLILQPQSAVLAGSQIYVHLVQSLLWTGLGLYSLSILKMWPSVNRFWAFAEPQNRAGTKSNQATPPAFEDYIWSPHQHKGFVSKKFRRVSFWIRFHWRIFEIYSGLRGFTSVSVLLVKFLWEQKSSSLHFSADLHIMPSAAVQFTPKS